MSRQTEWVRKAMLLTAAVVLLAGTSLPKRGTAAPAPPAPKAASSSPSILLPPPPVPDFGSVVDLSASPAPAPAPVARPPVVAKPTPVVPAPRAATPVKPTVTVIPPAPVKAPVPVVARPRVVPVPPVPMTAPPIARQAPEPAMAAVPPAAVEKEWKVLIRPEFYKANDPWEYVRTGEISWSAPAANSAAPQPANPAAAGNTAAPGMAGSYSGVVPASGVNCGQQTYKSVYAAVPFSRAEYEANPGYRHDAAMELLFGTLRPTTIVKQTQPYFSRYPDMFRNRRSVFPYLTPSNNTVDVNYYWNYPGYW